LSVVFTDTFTVGSNIGIASYPSGSPDYAYTAGGTGGDTITVIAATGRAKAGTTSNVTRARIIDASVPSGDQQITADCWHGNDSGATYVSGGVCARMASGSDNCYYTYINNLGTDETELYRVDSGSATLIASWNDGNNTNGAVYQHRLKVTGAGATVAIEVQVGNGSVHTHNDTHANRKTSGTPGVVVYDPNGIVYVDNVSVDDLVVAATGQPTMRRFMFMPGSLAKRSSF
jgi:hypothetical protein